MKNFLWLMLLVCMVGFLYQRGLLSLEQPVHDFNKTIVSQPLMQDWVNK